MMDSSFASGPLRPRTGARRARPILFTASAILLSGLTAATAQGVQAATADERGVAAPIAAAPVAAGPETSLPDAPDAVPDAVPDPKVLDPQAQAPQASVSPQHPPMASPFAKFIRPGQPAPRLNTYDKVVIGFKDSVTPFSALGWVTSATYEQITDGPPNYGQTGKGYAQRIGAAAARGTSEGVFAAAVFSPIFHTDPRYYKLGDRVGTFHRIVYAASRTLITRTDGGRTTVNSSLLLGYLGGTSLAQAYYPRGNRGINALARTYGESLLGASLSFTVSEFLSDALALVHLQTPRL